jgi:prevent-host-death family protein
VLKTMKTMQVREAKASLSAVVEAAQNGEPTVITKHGKAAAMVVPIAEGQKLYPDDRDRQKQRDFVDFLLTYPGGIELERNESPSREVDF